MRLTCLKRNCEKKTRHAIYYGQTNVTTKHVHLNYWISENAVSFIHFGDVSSLSYTARKHTRRIILWICLALP